MMKLLIFNISFKPHKAKVKLSSSPTIHTSLNSIWKPWLHINTLIQKWLVKLKGWDLPIAHKRLLLYPMDNKIMSRIDKSIHGARRFETKGRPGAVMKSGGPPNLPHLPKISDKEENFKQTRKVSKWKLLRGPIHLLNAYCKQKRYNG